MGLLAALVVVLLSALAPATRAAEGDADDAVAAFGLSATVGVGGHDVAGAWRPVTVTLAPEVPLQGQLLLAADRDGSTLVTTRPVEVPAGATQRHHLLVPPGARPQVQVLDDASGRTATLNPQGQAGGFLVGVLGGIEVSAVPSVTAPTTDQRATVVAVDDALLDLGARALQSLGTLVVAESDLLALPAAHRDALTQRVAEGAGLVVVGTTRPDLGLPWQAVVGVDGGALDPAPGAWGATLADLVGDGADGADEPDADDAGGAAPSGEVAVAAVAAGRGRLVVTTATPGNGALASPGPWEHLLQPGTNAALASGRATQDLPALVEQAFGPVGGEPPSIGWLAGFFAVYVLVVGPVLGLVLSRRRRPEMAWVVLPVVVALFAGAAVVGASGSRPKVGATAEVARWVDGAGTTLTVAGVRSPRAGEHTIDLPGGGWDVATASWSGLTRVTAGDDATRLVLSLPGQSFGSVLAERPLADPAPLDLEVAVFDGEARVEVTNTSDRPLRDLTLRLAAGSYELLREELAPGDTHVQPVGLRDGLPRQRDPFVERGFVDPGSETDPSDLARLLQWGVLDGAPGLAWVTATSDRGLGHGAERVDGSTPVDGGALVAIGVTPTVTDDTTLSVEVHRDIVAIGADTWVEAPLLLSGPGPATMRFRLPAEGAIDHLALDLDAGPAAMAQPVMPERCGMVELRDPETGDVVEAFDACGVDAAMCPRDAVTCEWGPEDAEVVEGRACFDDGACRDVRWVAQPMPPKGPPPGGGGGMEVWDHDARRWVAAVEAAPGGTTDAARPWVGPLGDVWVRATHELVPLDVAVQGVGAVLGGGGT